MYRVKNDQPCQPITLRHVYNKSPDMLITHLVLLDVEFPVYMLERDPPRYLLCRYPSRESSQCYYSSRSYNCRQHLLLSKEPFIGKDTCFLSKQPLADSCFARWVRIPCFVSHVARPLPSKEVDPTPSTSMHPTTAP